MNVLTEAIQTTVIGMLVVFVGLTILIFIIGFIRFLSKEEKSTPAPLVEANEPAYVAQAALSVPATDDAIAAAIAAAVSIILEAEGQTSGFVVRRIRRINR